MRCPCAVECRAVIIRRVVMNPRRLITSSGWDITRRHSPSVRRVTAARCRADRVARRSLRRAHFPLSFILRARRELMYGAAA